MYSKIRTLAANDAATPFQQHHIPPHTVHLSELFTSSDNPETIFFVHMDADLIFRKNTRLQRPYTFSFRRIDQILQ